MTEPASARPAEVVRPLLRVRQFREFTSEPVDDGALDAIADAARWSGSGMNTQPWRFIVIRDVATIREIAAAGPPQTRGLQTAPAAIAVVLRSETPSAEMRGFDEGRAVERMLAAATMLGLGAGISWIRPDVLPAAMRILAVPDGWFVHTIVAVGHPTDEARKPKAAPGEARLPRSRTVFTERWQGE